MIGADLDSVPNTANLWSVGETETMTRRKAAEHLGVSVRTIDYYLSRGYLRRLRNEQTHYIRLSRDEVLAMARRRETYCPAQLVG